MKKLRWGIIGPGSIAEEFARDLSLANEQSHYIAGVLGNNWKTAKLFADTFEVPDVFTDIEKFIKTEMDAVYIATPHILHYEQSLFCLENHIPVLCEKPITINAKQLHKLIDTAVLNNTFLMEGMWIRFLPSIKKVLELIAQHRIGTIISVKANMSYRAPQISSSRYFNPELGGGSLLDLGIYPVFLATLLLGKPIEIKAVAAISDKGIDEACSILLNYTDKQYAVLESSLITESDLVAEIAGDKGRIKILSPWNERPQAILMDIFDDCKIEFPCKWEGRGFQYEVEEVVQCLENNLLESELMPHQLSLDVMEIMDTVREQINVKYLSAE